MSSSHAETLMMWTYVHEVDIHVYCAIGIVVYQPVV